MDFSDHSPLSIKDPNSWKVQIIEKEIDEWDYFNYRLEKTMIQIEFTQEHQIIYSKNGNVLRMEDEFNTFKVQELFNTIEQIKYLTYQVQNNQKKEIGKRITFWDKKVLENVGGYYEYGQKIGLWKELIENYWSHAQVFLTGEYYKGLKTGIWSYKYNNLKIGSGRYNQQGKKFGKWIDLDGFWDQSQIKYKGEYNMSGVKVGRWDIMYCKNGDDKYKQIGGGSYDQAGGQIKIGNWIELVQGFYYYRQVTYNGKYNMTGVKIDRWDVMYCKNGDGKYQQIGGGSYDQDGSQIKIGNWIELVQGFYYNKQVTYNGEYDKKGMKVGRWDIMYCKCGDQKQKLIGSGSYHKDGGEIKIGKWVELDKGFRDKKQVIYIGEYNIKGRKLGRWNIMYCHFLDIAYKQIGGGFYDDGGSQIKVGKWIELDEGFRDKNQVTQNGEYNMKGVKIGTWVMRNIMQNEIHTEEKYDN